MTGGEKDGSGKTVFTIGHSTRPIGDFIAALKAAGVDCIADVRRFPRSRRHPHFNNDALACSLAEAGIDYRHFEALGGRRGAAPAKPSSNTLWREEPFRNYADYAETAEFGRALDALEALVATRRVAVMCAEAVWWRCHRRIVADYLLARGDAVVHIMDKGKCEPASLTPGAVARGDGTVAYPAKEPLLPL
jgi:uncharacterized protein (DUF488 family)